MPSRRGDSCAGPGSPAGEDWRRSAGFVESDEPADAGLRAFLGRAAELREVDVEELTEIPFQSDFLAIAHSRVEPAAEFHVGEFDAQDDSEAAHGGEDVRHGSDIHE